MKLEIVTLIILLTTFCAEPVRCQATNDSGGPRPSNYRLVAGDTISIKVLGEPELTTTPRIARDGSIEFPFIGTVKVAGKTTAETAGIIAGLLDKDYLVRPQVTVDLLGYAERSFTISGQVAKTGLIPIPPGENMDLLRAVMLAGGFTRMADPGKITISRQVNGRQETIKIDARPLMKKGSTEIVRVLPNDAIIVGESLF